MKKTNNQGFSLVELIIVIAIMAILVGVLAPQFIKYVEKTRAQKDASAVEELRNATEVALADEAVYTQLVSLSGNQTITVAAATNATIGVPVGLSALKAELDSSIGTSLKFSSKSYTQHGATITITVSGNGYTVTAASPNP